MESKTSPLTQALILGELYVSYSDDQGLKDFFEYNDLGLPLSYAVANDIVELKDHGARLINETFQILLEVLDVEDVGFDGLEHLLEISEYEDNLVRVVRDGGEEEDVERYAESYRDGFRDGAAAEQSRIQEVTKMHMRWAEEQNKGRDYMLWKSVGEVLTPIEIEPMTDKKWQEELEKDGF